MVKRPKLKKITCRLHQTSSINNISDDVSDSKSKDKVTVNNNLESGNTITEQNRNEIGNVSNDILTNEDVTENTTHNKYKIKITSDYDYNQKTILSKTIEKIQQDYDINPIIIENWLKDEMFEDKFKNVISENFVSVFKETNEELDKLLSIINEEKYVDDNFPDDKLKCGMILDEYNNGYINYCNQHKYLHQIGRENTDNRLNKDMINIINSKKNAIEHTFVCKSGKEILDEKIFVIKFNIYRKFINNSAVHLYLKFIDEIFVNYNTYLVHHNYLDEVVKWLKTSEKDFISTILHSKSNSDEQNYIKLYINHANYHNFMSVDNNRKFKLISIN